MHSHFSVTKLRGCQDGSDYGLALLTRDPIMHAPSGHLLSQGALRPARRAAKAAVRGDQGPVGQRRALINGTSDEAAAWRRREADKISGC